MKEQLNDLLIAWREKVSDNEKLNKSNQVNSFDYEKILIQNEAIQMCIDSLEKKLTEGETEE